MHKDFLSRLLVAGLASIILYGCSNASTAHTNAQNDTHTIQSFHFDVETAENETELIQSSKIIIRGSFTGEVKEIQTSNDTEKLFSDYFYTIHVDEVLAGNIAQDKITVVSGGVSSVAKEQGLISTDEYAKPFDTTHKKYIFFLEPSAKPDVYQIVGHASGIMKLDDKDKTKDVAPEVKGLENLDLTALKDKITEEKKLKK